MDEHGLTFEEGWEIDLARKISASDPNTPFPVIEYLCEDAHQVIVIIRSFGVPIGFSLIVAHGPLEMFRFFIDPRYRGIGLAMTAARGVIRMVFESGQPQIVLSAIDERSENFWHRVLEGQDYRSIGNDRFIVCSN